MGAAVALLAELAKSLVGGWLDRAKQKQQLQAAIATRKIQMAADTQQYNQQWELQALADSDKWLRRGSFVLLTWPLLWAAYAPGAANDYFSHTLAALPQWYTITYMGMVSAIWGVKSLQRLRPWRNPDNVPASKPDA